MKFNYKKVASVLASAVMLSSTIGFAAAASYPAPFVVSGSADGAVIVGANAAPADWAAAVDLGNDLSKRVSSGTTSTVTTTGGDAKSLASGSDLVYLNDDLAENVETITKSNLKTVLADGTFTDDGGTEYDYEQTIAVGTSTSNGLKFSTSGNDLDDPTVLLALTSNPSTTPAYTLTVSFDTAVPFNTTDSKGEVIKLFGKEYTVGTSTDGDTLVLLGGASETTVNVGEKVTAEVNGVSYEVSLAGISSADTAAASISINGDSKTFTEGQTKKVAGIDVYAKTIFRTGDNAGYVIVQLGSDKLTLENGNAVQTGSENNDIEGTNVVITGGVNAMTQLQIQVAAADSDTDYILQGKSFKDPVFGTVSLDFVDLKNGPTLVKEVDTSDTRKTLAITKEGDRELGLSVTVPGHDAKTLPFVYQGILADDNSEPIHVIEGANMSDDDYFILNSGDYQYFMQLTKVDLSAGDVQFKNVITGETYTDLVNDDTKINETVGTSTTFTIDSQTFNVTSKGGDNVAIYSSDWTTKRAIYPYLELVDDKAIKVAMTDNVTIGDTIDSSVATVSSKIYELPTGNLQFQQTNNSPTVGYKIDGASAWSTQLASAPDINYTVGSVDYFVDLTYTNSTLTIVKIGLAEDNHFELNPGVIFVEEEDKSYTTSGTEPVVIIPTNDTSTFTQVGTPLFTGTVNTDYATAAFDDTDFTGYITNFGTYVLKDASDADQTMVKLTYSANGQQMYGEVFISETGASITPGSSGSGGLIAVYKDNEVEKVKDKNLLVVGGSCINTVALKIIDSTATLPICGADFTTKTTVGSGQYIIKTVKSPYNDAKLAVLVAGFESTQTADAVAKLKEGTSTDVGEKVYPIIGSQ